MENTAGCGVDKTKNNLESMRQNIANNPDAIYPMFTLENLSMNGTAPSCLAYNYFGVDPKTSGGTLKSNVCGTIDGFSYWDWDKFLEFMTLFAHKYNVKQVGIYESQFIPPAWMPNGSFLNDCSPNNTTTGDTACSNIPVPSYLSMLKACPVYTPPPAPSGPTTAPVNCAVQCPTGQGGNPSYCRTDKSPPVCSGLCSNPSGMQYNCTS